MIWDQSSNDFGLLFIWFVTNWCDGCDTSFSGVQQHIDFGSLWLISEVLWVAYDAIVWGSVLMIKTDIAMAPFTCSVMIQICQLHINWEQLNLTTFLCLAKYFAGCGLILSKSWSATAWLWSTPPISWFWPAPSGLRLALDQIPAWPCDLLLCELLPPSSWSSGLHLSTARVPS